jgi:hypothetical protein
MVIHLVREKLLENFQATNLGVDDVWKDYSELLRLLIVRLFVKNSLIDVLPLLIRIVVDPCKPNTTLGHISHHDKVICPGCGTFYPELESQILEFQKVVNLDLIKPLLINFWRLFLFFLG